jgi:Mg2+ and Co2+ transporter CorA
VETHNNAIEEDTKTNLVEEKDNRKLAKESAALQAKLKFIQDKYDFNSNVRQLKPDEFTELENTNEEVIWLLIYFPGDQDCRTLQGQTDHSQERIQQYREQHERQYVLSASRGY